MTKIISVIEEKGAERFLDVTAERKDLFQRLKNCKVIKENLGQRMSGRNVILKAMTTSRNPLTKKLISVKNEKRLLENIIELLMIKYNVLSEVMEKSIGKLAFRASTRFCW